MSEPTPGTWEFEGRYLVSKQQKEGFVDVLTIARLERTSAEAEANGRLMAAAPDLLVACKAFLLPYEGIDAQEYHSQVFADVLQSIRDAVAKAEGRLA